MSINGFGRVYKHRDIILHLRGDEINKEAQEETGQTSQFSWLNARARIINKIIEDYEGLELVKLDQMVEKWNTQELPEKIQTRQIVFIFCSLF